MIIRKPYAFFIKMFKPIHIIMTILASYLLYLENRILTFFNNYINTSINVVGQNLKGELASNLLFIIPIILIVFSILIFIVMTRKKKPSLFYVVTIFSLIAVIVINIYSTNFLGTLEETIVSIKSVKLIHDMVMISVLISIALIVFLVLRGIGVNIKKFDFNSEISKINIDESDKEEIELNLKIDLDESKRNRKRKIRNLRYIYIENKFFINIAISIFVLIIIFLTASFIYKANKVNKEGTIYQMSGFNYSVDNTMILNTDYRGNKITDNYLIVISVRMNSYFTNKSLYLKDFNLKIGDLTFKATTEYSGSLIDIGYSYNGEVLSNEYQNYLFVYEIPEKFIESDMYFRYVNLGESFDIKLNPKNKEFKKIDQTKNLTNEISFRDILGDIKFSIDEYEIKKQFLIQYNYCVRENDCVNSKEYLKASIDKNYDKYVLRLKLNYSDNTDLNLKGFYDFFSKFGQIYYYKNNDWHIQSGGFEEIKSKKTSDKDNIYIGVNSEINNSTAIKLVFNIRNSKYEYILKGEI